MWPRVSQSWIDIFSGQYKQNICCALKKSFYAHRKFYENIVLTVQSVKKKEKNILKLVQFYYESII